MNPAPLIFQNSMLCVSGLIRNGGSPSTILAHWRRSPLAIGRADRNDAGLATALKS
jgi:hypothetical protein